MANFGEIATVGAAARARRMFISASVYSNYHVFPMYGVSEWRNERGFRELGECRLLTLACCRNISETTLLGPRAWYDLHPPQMDAD